MTAQDDTCHPAGPGRRALGPRHAGSHDECQPCEARHCGECGATHVRKADPPVDPGERTCPRCIGNTRMDVAAIKGYVAQLPDEAEHHSRDEIPGGTATYLLGAVSLDYPLMQAHAIITAIDWAPDRGCDGHGHPETCAWPRTSCCRLTEDDWVGLTAGDPWPSDPTPPLWPLATWEDCWRDVLDAGPGPRPATVDTAADWLMSILHRVAQHDAWPQFAADIRQCRARLEGVLQAGNWPARGVPCISVDCTADLRQTYADPDPCTHDTPARRLPRQLVRENAAARAAIAALGYPEHLGYPVPIPHSTGAIRAALRLARRPCEATGCDQGGRRPSAWCPRCGRKYTYREYESAKANHKTRLRLRERAA